MPESGKFDLTKLKAIFNIDDFHLVDIKSVNSTNETRLYFEISFAIGIPLSVLFAEKCAIESHFEFPLFISAFAFMGFGIYMLRRYLKKHEELSKISHDINTADYTQKSSKHSNEQFENLKTFLKKFKNNDETYLEFLYKLVKQQHHEKLAMSIIPLEIFNEFKLKNLCYKIDENHFVFTASAYDFINWIDLYSSI